MKKILVIFVVLALLITITVPAFAAKKDVPPGQAKKLVQEQEENSEKVKIEKEVRKEEQKIKENGAEKFDFFLSGDVMPVPPYGLSDIEGSAESSKLIVNQPNGKPAANVTGIMKGLDPETEYTVYISNGYEPYAETEEWNMIGDYTFTLMIGGSEYVHDITIETQVDGVLTGTGGYPSIYPSEDPPAYSITEQITGTIDGDTVVLNSLYLSGNPGYEYRLELTIALDGTLSGNWFHNATGEPLEMVVEAGTAKVITTGNTGWSGLLSSEYIPPFTFTTDVEGHASWHINIYCEMIDCLEGEVSFSVWINRGGTILISETIVMECECEPEMLIE